MAQYYVAIKINVATLCFLIVKDVRDIVKVKKAGHKMITILLLYLLAYL